MSGHDGLRNFNKKVTNRIFSAIAGKKNSPYALLSHRGRSSAKSYSTPVIAVRKGDQFYFTLPYGTKVDWFRNVLAAGGGEIRWQGGDYLLSNPQPLNAAEGLAVFNPFVRILLELNKVKDFAVMDGKIKKPSD